MNHKFKASETFWRSFYALNPDQKESTRRAWQIFRANPFDHRLRPHKIHSLSARYRRVIHAVEIEGDLRVVFFVQDDIVYTVDIGTHAIYRS